MSEPHEEALSDFARRIGVPVFSGRVYFPDGKVWEYLRTLDVFNEATQGFISEDMWASYRRDNET